MNRVAPVGQPQDDTSLEYLIRNNQKIQVTTAAQCFPRTCKICLEEQSASCMGSAESEETPNQNELIIACECRGSVGYVHQKCIKLWIQRQNKVSKAKRAFCQICKSEIFFKRMRVNYCDCTLANLCDTSPCNIISLVGELVVIAVLSLVQHNLARLPNFELLRNILLALLGLISLICLITIILIIRQTFVRTHTQICRIYSLEESQRLGFVEPKQTDKQIVVKSRRARVSRMSKGGRVSGNPFGAISPDAILPQSTLL